ncbi:hypothetical protein [Desulfolithobacter sp.]
MNTKGFEVKPYPDMWTELDMDVPRFDKARQMLSEVYDKMFLSQPNRPEKMAYFDNSYSRTAQRIGLKVSNLTAKALLSQKTYS